MPSCGAVGEPLTEVPTVAGERLIDSLATTMVTSAEAIIAKTSTDFLRNIFVCLSTYNWVWGMMKIAYFGERDRRFRSNVTSHFG